MNAIFDLMNPTRWLLLGGMVLALALGTLKLVDHIGDVREEIVVARYEKAIGAQKLQAAGMLATETAKVLVLERALADMKSKQEADYEKRRMDSRSAGTALDAAAAAHGGQLRDPNAAGCGRGGGGAEGAALASAGSGAAPAAETGRLLSVQLSDLLRDRLREADEFNDTYALCRDYAIGVRARINPVSSTTER